MLISFSITFSRGESIITFTGMPSTSVSFLGLKVLIRFVSSVPDCGRSKKVTYFIFSLVLIMLWGFSYFSIISFTVFASKFEFEGFPISYEIIFDVFCTMFI